MRAIRLVEKGFVIFTLILLTDGLAFRSLFVEPEGTTTTDVGTSTPFDSFLALIQYGVFAITFFLLCVHWRSVIRAARRDIFLWGLVVVMLASMVWSDFPEQTQRSSLLVIQTTLFGLYLSARYSLKDQLYFVAWALGIVALLSLLFSLLFSGSAIEHGGLHEGAWRGIFFHKNNLGRYMTLGATALLLIALNSHKYRDIMWIGCSLAVSLMLLSTSKTALLIFLILILLLRICHALRWSYSLAIPFFIAVLLIVGAGATVFVDNSETILVSLGKDPSLSGRTDIWAAVLDKIWERPWLGYGYQAFWVAEEDICIGECDDVRRAIGFDAVNSHNGFLDLGVELGLLGFLLFLLSFLVACRRAISWVRLTTTAEGFWPLLYLTSMFLFNQSESPILGTRSFYWAIYVTITLSLRHVEVRPELWAAEQAEEEVSEYA